MWYRGAYGSVYLGLVESTGSLVAVKEILYMGESTADRELVDAFEAEVGAVYVYLPALSLFSLAYSYVPRVSPACLHAGFDSPGA